MEKIPMTQDGLTRMEAELKDLKSVQRPEVITAIAEAREHGDLKENAEYHAARERQGFIEGRIQELEAVVSRADVIDVSKLKGDSVMFGATVKVVDEETEKEMTYQIVGEHEADLSSGRISMTAPIARALIGKKAGDSVEVAAPGGERYYEILEVMYK